MIEAVTCICGFYAMLQERWLAQMARQRAAERKEIEEQVRKEMAAKAHPQ